MNKTYTETFNLIVNEYNKETKIQKMHEVKIFHDFWTWKPLKKQAKETIPELKKCILKEIIEGRKSGIYNYNNFECRIDWDLIGTKEKQRGISKDGYRI